MGIGNVTKSKPLYSPTTLKHAMWVCVIVISLHLKGRSPHIQERPMSTYTYS